MAPTEALQSKIARPAVVVATLLLCPSAAFADAGIPMLPVAYPSIVLFLVPVIALEAAYIRLRLRSSWRNTLIATTKANLLTMLLGYPLTWLLCFVLEIAFWFLLDSTGIPNRLPWKYGIVGQNVFLAVVSAAWLGPVKERWPLLVAFVILLIPSFLLSGFVESRLLDGRNWLKHDSSSTSIVWQANVISYVFLGIAGCFLTWQEIR